MQICQQAPGRKLEIAIIQHGGCGSELAEKNNQTSTATISCEELCRLLSPCLSHVDKLFLSTIWLRLAIRTHLTAWQDLGKKMMRSKIPTASSFCFSLGHLQEVTRVTTMWKNRGKLWSKHVKVYGHVAASRLAYKHLWENTPLYTTDLPCLPIRNLHLSVLTTHLLRQQLRSQTGPGCF